MDDATLMQATLLALTQQNVVGSTGAGEPFEIITEIFVWDPYYKNPLIFDDVGIIGDYSA